MSSEHQFKYMDEDTLKLARAMIHKLSRLLGPKRCAIYADGCIANIFDSLASRMQNLNPSLSDTNHFTWIQQNYGLAVISVEVRV